MLTRDGISSRVGRQASISADIGSFPAASGKLAKRLEECLQRELWEELNVRIDLPLPFQIVRHEYPEKIVELHFFRCRIESGEAVAQDCAELRWVYPHEMAAFQFPPADQAIITALQQERL